MVDVEMEGFMPLVCGSGTAEAAEDSGAEVSDIELTDGLTFEGDCSFEGREAPSGRDISSERESASSKTVSKMLEK